MKNLFFKTKRMSVQMQRLLMMMATIMMAFATLTACDILEDNNDENGKEEEGGNGGGGVSGKRLKTILHTSGPIDGIYKTEYSYDNDGSLKRIDYYDEHSKLTGYTINTSNPDGTWAKYEMYLPNGTLDTDMHYTYDSNKKPIKGQGTLYHAGGNTQTIDYTFQNGRQIRQVLKVGTIVDTFEHSYDSNGRRTTTTETHRTCQ